MTVSAEPPKPVTLNERETYLLEALEGLLDALPSATTHPAIQAATPPSLRPRVSSRERP